MKIFIKKLYNLFLNSKLVTKIFIFFSLAIYTTILLFTLIKVNYEVVMPGGLTHVSNYIDIETEESTGNVFTVSVYTKKRLSLFQKWVAGSNPHVDLEEYDPDKVLSDKDEIKQGTVLKDTSIDYSIIVAYREASKVNPAVKINYDFKGIIIYHIASGAPTELGIGDTITKVNGAVVTEENYQTILFKTTNDDTCDVKDVTLTIKKENSSQEKEVIVPENCLNKYLVNVRVLPAFNIKETTPAYDKKKIRNLGPSGGLMQTLGIYNTLIPNQDITKGFNIAGTGTINPDGTSGEIGGIKQKIITAYLFDAFYKFSLDIFFVTSENYEEAKTMYDKIQNPSYELVEVSSFSEVLAHLEKKEAKK